jgi:hypothetical protein
MNFSFASWNGTVKRNQLQSGNNCERKQISVRVCVRTANSLSVVVLTTTQVQQNEFRVTVCEKKLLFCHSERSEESLFDQRIGTECTGYMGHTFGPIGFFLDEVIPCAARSLRLRSVSKHEAYTTEIY